MRKRLPEIHRQDRNAQEAAELASKLLESEMRHYLMMDQLVGYAIIFLDHKGNVVDWSKGAEKIMGYTKKEIVGENFSVFYIPEEREIHLPEKILEEAKKNKKAIYEGWRVRKDGSTFWASILITALLDEKSKLVGFSKLTRDLTTQKNTEDELQKHTERIIAQNSELKNTNKELSSFSYSASHDLQEPLRKILIFSSRLYEKHKEELSPEATALLIKIVESSGRMKTLIQNLLDYSKVGNNEKTFEQTDLNDTLKNVLSDFELLIEQKNARIISDTLPIISAVPLQMNQLFYNLISNALKFSKRDVPPFITITSYTIEKSRVLEYGLLNPKLNYCEIIVSDNGIGFDQKYANEIFVTFQRLNQVNEYPGTGIGLSLSKRIIENHSGLIFAEAEENKGVVFHIILPFNQN